MVLELTEEEHTRLQKMIIILKRREKCHKVYTEAEELKILEMIDAGMSTPDIRRVCGACSRTVLDIKKKYGRWGA